MSKEKSTKPTTSKRLVVTHGPLAGVSNPVGSAKRSPGRPRKSLTKTEKPRQDKARIVTVTTDAPELVAVPKGKNVLPKSVKKFAAAKAAPRRPLGRPTKKPVVNVAQLEHSLGEALTAKAETQAHAAQLEAELKEVRAENSRLQRTINRLREVIDDYKAKEAKPNWLRRVFGRDLRK